MPTARPPAATAAAHIRRYEHPHPGALVHIDVKKLGNIPAGGGHRFRAACAALDTTVEEAAGRLLISWR